MNYKTNKTELPEPSASRRDRQASLPKATTERGSVHSFRLYQWIRDESTERYFPGEDRLDEIVWFRRAA